MRQMTPTAKSEIASGMKSTILNTLAQPIRSVITASTRPNAVTAIGTTRIQMTLFLIAVWIVSSLNIRSQFWNPTKSLASSSA